MTNIPDDVIMPKAPVDFLDFHQFQESTIQILIVVTIVFGILSPLFSRVISVMLIDMGIGKSYIEKFNNDDEENVIQSIDNASAWGWLSDNMPFFECPDPHIEETYYFRWWVYRKHIKQTPDGKIITEFHPTVPWAGKHNSINCAAGHHFYEGRWLADRHVFLNDYALFWFRKGGNLRAYSTWLVDAIWNTCLVSGDFSLAIDLLPDFVQNYQAWEHEHLHASGLFWSIDDRDGMEYSISGPGLRPTLNTYMYADALAIARIARMAGRPEIEAAFLAKAETLKRLVEERLWDPQRPILQNHPAGLQRYPRGELGLHRYGPRS